MKWEALPLTSVQDIAAALPSQILAEKPRLLDGILRIKHLKLGSKNEKKIVFKSSKFLKKILYLLSTDFFLFFIFISRKFFKILYIWIDIKIIWF